ncbi:MAG TPA: glycosyltransferase [Herpetosiphonaceae bacterium]|nr:glycosyltransferase [Herpetosiphonaceae bacterium]
MKIGFVVDDHMGRPGGVQEYVRGLRAYLERQGHATVIFSGSGGPPERGVVPLGVSLPLRGSGSSTSIPLTLEPPWGLERLLRYAACDVLHVMAPYSPTLSGRLLVHSGAAHVMTFLVAIEPRWYLRMLAALATFQWHSLSRFHARIAISQAAAASARELYGGVYRIVPVGIDVDRFRPPAVPASATDDNLTILYIGRLEQRKGVANLLRAVARLQRERHDVRLEIGGDGPERQALERLADELGLRDVHFRGYVPPGDLPRLLHRADLFCAPATHAESFGIVLLEAMAAGLPIVAAANAGYAEVLAAHPDNLLVRPGDDRSLAGALASLAAAPAYRAEIGRRNLAAAQNYSWDAVGSAILKVYDSALMLRRACVRS